MHRTLLFLLLIPTIAAATSRAAQPSEQDYAEYFEKLSQPGYRPRPEVADSVTYMVKNARQIMELPATDPLRGITEKVLRQQDAYLAASPAFKLGRYAMGIVVGLLGQGCFARLYQAVHSAVPE